MYETNMKVFLVKNRVQMAHELVKKLFRDYEMITVISDAYKQWKGRETRLGEGREGGRQESPRQVCSKA